LPTRESTLDANTDLFDVTFLNKGFITKTESKENIAKIEKSSQMDILKADVIDDKTAPIARQKKKNVDGIAISKTTNTKAQTSHNHQNIDTPV
jgi:hypothetical protein